MYFELVSKLVTVAASVFALYKIIIEMRRSNKPHLREEFKFVREFITVNSFYPQNPLPARVS
jgi:hypothetical protein